MTKVDERAIRELVQTWMTATKAGDIQTVLSLMTDDSGAWRLGLTSRLYRDNYDHT
jgi:uncharacterized protein (TIGR02246 family)